MTAVTEPEGVLVELDDRRRASLTKLGLRHRRYLVTECEDGTLIWTPARVVSEMDYRLMNNTELREQMQARAADPRPGSRRRISRSERAELAAQADKE